MSGYGLSEQNQRVITEKMMDLAQKMSSVDLDFTIDNTANDYPVSENLQLYTLSGEITTAYATKQFLVLSDKGVAGKLGYGAPAAGKILN